MKYFLHKLQLIGLFPPLEIESLHHMLAYFQCVYRPIHASMYKYCIYVCVISVPNKEWTLYSTRNFTECALFHSDIPHSVLFELH